MRYDIVILYSCFVCSQRHVCSKRLYLHVQEIFQISIMSLCGYTDRQGVNTVHTRIERATAKLFLFITHHIQSNCRNVYTLFFGLVGWSEFASVNYRQLPAVNIERESQHFYYTETKY